MEVDLGFSRSFCFRSFNFKSVSLFRSSRFHLWLIPFIFYIYRTRITLAENSFRISYQENEFEDQISLISIFVENELREKRWPRSFIFLDKNKNSLFDKIFLK